MRGSLGRGYNYDMTTKEAVPRTRAVLALVGLATGIFLMMLNWRDPFLRVEPGYLNRVVFGVTCLSPWLALFLVRPFRHVAVRVVVRTIAVSTGVALLPLAIGS